MSGFRIAGFHRALQLLERFGGEIAAVDREGRGSFTAEVARISPNGEVGARLLDISASKFAALSQISLR